MARMVPKTIPLDRPASERTVFQALSWLSDDWIVFYSVGWQSKRHGRQGDGEADFVLLHRRGLLVLEVKGGAVRIVGGQWQSISSRSQVHDIRDPFQQALDSRKTLQRYLRERLPHIQKLATGHGVCCPDIRIVDDLGPEGPRAIVWDRDELRDVVQATDRLASYWRLDSTLSPSEIKAIRDLIAPTITIRPLLRELVEDVHARLLELTSQQVIALSMLRRNRRAIVYGGAGTGKTILAVERARQLARDGFSVLLVCFNRPLGQYLARQFEGVSPIRATSFHALCQELALRAGEKISERPSQTWWDEILPAAAPDYARRVGFSCSAIVVDEGQDFMPEWWFSLELLLRQPEQDPFYVFVDTAQQIYRRDWQPPFPGPAMDLTINCRSTMEIAGRVAGVFGSEIPTLGTSGPDPSFLTAKDPEQTDARLQSLLVEYLVKGRLRPDQVVVLSTSRPEVGRLRGREFAGFGLVAPDEDGVVTETVHRFKGLEADAVILLLPSLEGVEDRALAYIGMSRARAQLAVLGPPEVRAALTW
jgi:Nuclease-related domain/UvrD-like helicase C-terminal domain/AAA domain